MRSVALLLALALAAASAVPAAALEYCFEYPSGVFDPTWTPDARTEWHQVVPVYCEWYEQTGHDDADCNGQIDPCEYIYFNDQRYHVDWIGPTYKLVSVEDPSEVRMVEDHEPGGKPFIYHEVYPTFCNAIETDSPLVQACQEVQIIYPTEDCGTWHVAEVNTNIRATPDMSPAQPSTWGKIKALFQRLREIF